MDGFETRLAELERRLGALSAENESLRAANSSLMGRLARLETGLPAPEALVAPVAVDGAGEVADRSDAGDADGPGGTAPLERLPVSRRGMIAAVAGAAGGMLLAQAAPAAAATGDPVLAGQAVTASASTTVTTSSLVGLSGISNDGTHGIGVSGRAAALSNKMTFGVVGRSSSSAGIGVLGYVPAATGLTYGVYGNAASPAGYALYGFGRLKVTGRSYQATPNSAPADADLDAGSISFYLNEAGNQLKVRVKYAGGVLKTGTVNLA